MQQVGGRRSFARDDIEPQMWRRRALCAETDPEAFYPDIGESARVAKGICAACEVRRECLDYALAHDQTFGIWGGLTPPERRRHLRAQHAG